MNPEVSNNTSPPTQLPVQESINLYEKRARTQSLIAIPLLLVTFLFGVSITFLLTWLGSQLSTTPVSPLAVIIMSAVVGVITLIPFFIALASLLITRICIKKNDYKKLKTATVLLVISSVFIVIPIIFILLYIFFGLFR